MEEALLSFHGARRKDDEQRQRSGRDQVAGTEQEARRDGEQRGDDEKGSLRPDCRNEHERREKGPQQRPRGRERVQASRDCTCGLDARHREADGERRDHPEEHDRRSAEQQHREEASDHRPRRRVVEPLDREIEEWLCENGMAATNTELASTIAAEQRPAAAGGRRAVHRASSRARAQRERCRSGSPTRSSTSRSTAPAGATPLSPLRALRFPLRTRALRERGDSASRSPRRCRTSVRARRSARSRRAFARRAAPRPRPRERVRARSGRRPSASLGASAGGPRGARDGGGSCALPPRDRAEAPPAP